MATVEERVGNYKPGSIRRIKLHNFVTYADVEFCPGPRLNMVVGPNGTGKSTILCAICLGLGGEPKLLGRADDARTFIMHDKDRAVIEIELAPRQQEGAMDVHVLKRVIDRHKGSEHSSRGGLAASTYYINNAVVTAKAVRQLVGDTYHISVDNLCTFLPQDRVGNFSAFDAQALLQETEKSLSGTKHLYETHNKLIAMEDDLRKGGNDVHTIEAKLKQLRTENERLEREKQRMEEREAALIQLELLEKKYVWLKYDDARIKAVELKGEKDRKKSELRQAQQKLQPLEEAHAVLVVKKQRCHARYSALDIDIQRSKKEMDKNKSKVDNHNDEIEDIYARISSLDAAQRTMERAVKSNQDKVTQLEAELADHPSEEQVNRAQAQAAEDVRNCRPAYEDAKREVARLHQTINEMNERKASSEDKLRKMNDEKAQRNARIFRQQPQLHQVVQWLDQNRKLFRRPIWGPVVCEVTTKSNNAAAFLEFHVPNSLLKTFVVECREDYDLLYREVRQKLGLPINIQVVPNGKLDAVSREYSDKKFDILKREHGVLGYMDDSFTAPDAVMQALRSVGGVDRVLIGSEKTQESLDRKGLLGILTQKEDGTGLKSSMIFSSLGDRSYRYNSSISRYSKKASLSVDEVRPPRWLAAGVNPAHRTKLEQDLREMEQEVAALRPRLEEASAKEDQVRSQAQDLHARLKNAKEAQATLNQLHQRLRNAQHKLRQAQEAASSDRAGEKERLLRQLMVRMTNCLSALECHAACHEQIMQSTCTAAGVKINQDGLFAAERQAHAALIDAQQEFVDIEREAVRVKNAFDSAKTLMAKFKRLAEQKAPLHDADGKVLPLQSQLEELPVTTLAETEAAMEEASAKANSIDANADVIRQYEERKLEIEQVEEQLSYLHDSKDSKIAELEKCRMPWEEALRNAVSKVNILFAKYMSEVGCAGEVRLSTGDDESSKGRGRKTIVDETNTGNFRDWGIQILVKFREKSKLQALSSHVQSGGERSVSTIMYLMALQELMVSPFRCVDEINQGLDDRNERLVFKRIVENSTKPPNRQHGLSSHSGQYFLITPKLLPNLTDMEVEALTVLFIFNGPYSFQSHSEWKKDEIISIKKREAAEGFDDPGEGDEDTPSAGNSGIPRRSQTKRRKSDHASR